MSTGIEARHARSCASRDGGRCTCTPSWQANVWDNRAQKRIRKTFPTRSAAKRWREDAIALVRKGKLPEAQPKTTVHEKSEAWLVDARAGIIRTRRGEPLKPATLRAYEQVLRLRVNPTLGTAQFFQVRRVHLQDLVKRLIAADVAPATIRLTIAALGAVFAEAVHREELASNPAHGVRLPAVDNGRMRFATPTEAVALLAAVPERDHPVWTVAMYAGLRRGELMALRWEDVDFASKVIHVRRGWDDHGPTTTKNGKERRVPMTGQVRECLVAHRLRQPPGVDLVLGLGEGRPFRADRLQQRADAAWKDAGLQRPTLKDCRHTFGSFSIAAGPNAKALCSAMGHSSVAITFDRYGHLMPGSEAEAAGLLDAYLGATG